MDLKVGNIIIGKPEMPPRMFRKEIHNHREEMEGRPFTSRNSTGTWMDSRVLHFPGLPQNSHNRLQGHWGQKKSLQEPVLTEVERRKEPRKDDKSR